jgi:hypothetical protein
VEGVKKRSGVLEMGTHLERFRGGSPERVLASRLEARWCTHSEVTTPPSGHELGRIDMFSSFCKSANVIYIFWQKYERHSVAGGETTDSRVSLSLSRARSPCLSRCVCRGFFRRVRSEGMRDVRVPK